MTKCLSTQISNVAITFPASFPSLHQTNPDRHKVTPFASQSKSWKWFWVFLMIFLPGVSQAQLQFTTNDLPCQIGQYNSSYLSSNVDVSGYLALVTNTGPPIGGAGATVLQFWGFAQGQRPCESILRTDIISPTNGASGSYFPSASYAEQDTMEPSSVIGWSYYGLGEEITNQGRIYYGFDEPVAGASPEAVFVPPTIDIPATVQLGQTWTRSLYWSTLYYEVILVSNYFAACATVDAAGSMALPGIGTVQALRVHEVHSYTISEVTDPPILLDMHTNDYYYWLVPGVGIVVQVVLYGTNVLYPEDMPYTNTVQRMFFANYFTNSTGTGSSNSTPTLSTNLQISIQGTSVVLNWDTFTNSTNYEVDYTTSLSPTNWLPLGTTTGNTWTDLMSYVQGFYRVVGTP
jgi:hypothetical protein